MVRPIPYPGLVLAVVLAAALGAAGPARAQLYPRLGLAGSIGSSGAPYVLSNGSLDPTLISQVARYDEIILDASPVTEYHPDILSSMRALNPGLKALAYIPAAAVWWMGVAPDSTVNIPSRYYRLVRDMNGWLYNKSGVLYNPLINVNLAMRDSLGNCVMADSLASLIYDAIVRPGVWDGLFLDVYCDMIGWSQTPTDSIDVVRAGYPDSPSFDAGWHAATDTLAVRLRQMSGPGEVLVGNCGMGTKYAWFNGWMRENFPFQDGGTWYSNMFGTPGGLFVDDASFLAPTHNYIFSALGTSNPYTADNLRRMRFGLGSATLGNGFGVFGPSDRNYATAPYQSWWFDEYAVNLATGRASALRSDAAWLGPSQGPWYQMIWAGSGPDAVTNPGFETSVTSGWTLSSGGGAAATVAWDTTTAAVGKASAHITVTSPGAYDWYSTYAATGSLAVNANQACSATFWAKASSPHRMGVNAQILGGPYAYQAVILGTTWKQYQLQLVAPAAGNAQLQLFLALDSGDVWLDDVHFQVGVTNLYRRDFQNGAVLVNPSLYTLTAPLGRQYRKILGTADPVTNDGSVISQVTIAASDALFLLNADMIPPAAVQDLRIVR